MKRSKTVVYLPIECTEEQSTRRSINLVHADKMKERLLKKTASD
jgi:hypothetical protein